METFQVVSCKTNSARVGDTFIIEDGLRTVNNISNKKVYMDDDSFYPKKLFAKWMRIERYLRKRREANIENNKAHKEELKKLKLGDFRPVNALRYLIIKTADDQYRWYFAKGVSSHGHLGEELRKTYPERDYIVVAGGFYTCIRSNAKVVLTDYWAGDAYKTEVPDTIILFGNSDTYGLARHHLQGAIEILREKYLVVVIDDLTKSFTNASW